MSPPGFVRLGDLVSFPRLRGDEPVAQFLADGLIQFSPPARG